MGSIFNRVNRMAKPRQVSYNSAMQSGRRTSYILGLLTLAALATLYATVTSYRYFWDTLIDCHYIEGPWNPAKLVHPQHPLFPLIAHIKFRWLTSDLTGMSIHIMRIVSIFFSIIGLGLFYAGLVRVTRSHPLAALATLSLGLTAAWWHHSIAGNPTIVSMAFILLSLLFILPGGNASPSKWMIFFHRIFFILAVMFSRTSALYLIPFTILVFTISAGREDVKSPFLSCIKYFIITFLYIAIPFYLIPGFLIGAWSPAKFSAWWNDYAGYLPHPTAGFNEWVRGLLAAGMGSIIALPRDVNLAFKAWQGTAPNLLSLPYFALVIIFVVGFVSCISYLGRKRAQLNRGERGFYWFCVMSILFVGGPVLIRQPYAITIFSLPFVTGIFALWASRIMVGKPKWVAWIWLLVPVILLVNNWEIKFDRDRNPDNNPYIYESTLVAQAISPEDILIDSGVDEGLQRHGYDLYFANVDSIDIFQIPGALEADRNRVRQELAKYYESGHMVIIHQDAVENEEAMQKLIDGMGAKFTPQELQDFILDAMHPAFYFVINSKKYYVNELAPERQIPLNIPILPVNPF